jgi:Resolvase, N terminal domain
MPTKCKFEQSISSKVFGHPLRVGLYARVSTHDQQTLPLQIRAMREYAAKRGWTIAAQIKEIGSGAAQRERRATLIAAARRREIDVVLVWRLDRWGRSVADLVSCAPGTAASPGGLRVADRSTRSHYARRPRHGRTALRVRRVRKGDPSRACLCRFSSRPAARQTPRPPAIGGSQRRRSPEAIPQRYQQTRDRPQA